MFTTRRLGVLINVNMKLKSIPVRLKEVRTRLGNGLQVGQTQRIGGSRWKRIREQILTDEPLCRNCSKHNRVSLATEVDHITPLWAGGKEYDLTNLQPLCCDCHIIKTSEEATQRSKQFN
jgi:5-methylcytosine-specific restriction protein A